MFVGAVIPPVTVPPEYKIRVAAIAALYDANGLLDWGNMERSQLGT